MIHLRRKRHPERCTRKRGAVKRRDRPFRPFSRGCSRRKRGSRGDRLSGHAAERRKETASPLRWVARAWETGVRLAAESPWPKHGEVLNHVQSLWVGHMLSDTSAKPPDGQYLASMSAFVDGYCSASGYRTHNWVLLPTNKTVAAVVTAMNEERTILAVLHELERLPLQELVLIVNGSSDGSFSAARSSRKAIIVHYGKALGHDVGRAIGARLTTADIVLFADADFPVPAEQFVPFVRAVDGGLDVALNDISPFVGTFAERDGVSVLKEFLNRALDRPDLTVNSLTAVPHALSRSAIARIGAAQLAVPPKAHAIALCSGLKVGAPASVDVISVNRLREGNTGTRNAVSQMIAGDHAEALEWAMRERDARLSFADNLRMRSLIKEGNGRC